MFSDKVEDGTLKVNTATVVGPVSGGTAGSISGRHESALANTLRSPGLYSTEKLYSAMNDSHLAIRCARCGIFTVVRKDAWSI